MKNTVRFFVMSIAIGIITVSCLISSTHKMDMNENLPIEQKAVVTFVNNNIGWFILKEWNGIDITDRVYGKKGVTSKDKAILTVPAGENSFLYKVNFTWFYNQSTRTVALDNIEMKYSYEPNKKYQVKGRTKSLGLFKKDELFVGIYEVDKNSVLLREWKLGEY